MLTYIVGKLLKKCLPAKKSPVCYLVSYRSNHLLKRFFCSKANIFFLFGGSLLKTGKWQPYVVLYRQKALKKSFPTKKSPYHYDFQYKSKKIQKKNFFQKKFFFAPNLNCKTGTPSQGPKDPKISDMGSQPKVEPCPRCPQRYLKKS